MKNSKIFKVETTVENPTSFIIKKGEKTLVEKFHNIELSIKNWKLTLKRVNAYHLGIYEDTATRQRYTVWSLKAFKEEGLKVFKKVEKTTLFTFASDKAEVIKDFGLEGDFKISEAQERKEEKTTYSVGDEVEFEGTEYKEEEEKDNGSNWLLNRLG